MRRIRLAQSLRPLLEPHPGLLLAAKRVGAEGARIRHSIAERAPATIQPRPRQLTIAITAHCNLRCRGCRYGRDFMPDQQLSLDTVQQVLDDAAEGGVERVRFYGGEPLLHRDLPSMVRRAYERGMRPYITTNGTHLGRKIKPLYDAGLRLATVGFYGIGERYDDYTGRREHFRRLDESLAAVRAGYGAGFELQLNYVLIRETCNVADLELAWAFATKHDMYFHVDLAN